MTRDVIVIGASAGGVEALRGLASVLPGDLPAAVLVVLHIPAGGASALAAILDRAGPLPVTTASDGARLLRGHVYTAPPDFHLLVADGEIRLSKGPSENGHRPAVNALFRSAARTLGPRCIGVVLSGALDDGAAGLSAIVARGGVAVVQDPADALYPSMPESALQELSTPYVMPVAAMGSVLNGLVREKVDTNRALPLSELVETEADLAASGEWEAEPEAGGLAVASGYSCPDCQGGLFTLTGTNRYRCRVGHAWSADALLQQKNDELEHALWTALRSLDEKTSLANRLRDRAVERHSMLIAARYEQAAEEAEHAARKLRSLLRTDKPADDAPSRAGS